MPLFMPASNRLSQIAENALEEEQYDIAISCMAQIADLGRHPSADLLRSLVAISLCSLPRTSGTKKPSAIARPVSRKTMERIAPTATMVNDARRLLQQLGKQGLFEIIFDAMLPVLSRKADDGDKSTKNKRSRAKFEEEYDDDKDDDGDSLNFASSPIGQFCQKMVECHNVWQIMALGDMMDSNSGHQLRSARRIGTKDRREGEESIRSNDIFDREGVWGVLEVFLQCWKNESGKRQTTSHFAEQFIEAPHRNREPRSKRAPSTYMGEAMDVIYAGLCPNSLVKPESEDNKSAKCRENERYRRQSIAMSILGQMFTLAKQRQLDKDAVLRATANLVEKVDSSAMMSMIMHLDRDFEYEWAQVAMVGLGSIEGEIQDDFPLDEYQECLAELKSIRKIPKPLASFFVDIRDGSWLWAAPRTENEMALVEFYDDHHSKKELAALGKNSAVKALLADKWKMTPTGRASKSSNTNMSWEQLCFAALSRRATMQVEAKNVNLKGQILWTILRLHIYTKGIPSCVKAYKRLSEICSAAIMNPAIEREKIMRKCCDEMEESYEQMKRDHGVSSTNGNGRSKAKVNSDTDDGLDEEEEEEDQAKIDWQKEMMRHLTACKIMCDDLAREIRTYSYHQDEPKGQKQSSKKA